LRGNFLTVAAATSSIVFVWSVSASENINAVYLSNKCLKDSSYCKKAFISFVDLKNKELELRETQIESKNGPILKLKSESIIKANNYLGHSQFLSSNCYLLSLRKEDYGSIIKEFSEYVKAFKWIQKESADFAMQRYLQDRYNCLIGYSRRDKEFATLLSKVSPSIRLELLTDKLVKNPELALQIISVISLMYPSMTKEVFDDCIAVLSNQDNNAEIVENFTSAYPQLVASIDSNVEPAAGEEFVPSKFNIWSGNLPEPVWYQKW
jgi:hypothetical protein